MHNFSAISHSLQVKIVKCVKGTTASDSECEPLYV